MFMYHALLRSRINPSGEAPIVFNAEVEPLRTRARPVSPGFADRPIMTTCTLVTSESLYGRIPDSYQQRFRFTESQSQPIAIGSRSLEINTTGFLLAAVARASRP